MSKEKITDPLDDGRQKVDVDYEEESLNEEKQKKQKQKSDAILTPIFLLFICIPIGFIIYFWKFYDPSVAVEQTKVAEHQVFEMATNPSVTASTNVIAGDGSQDDELTETEKTAAAIAAQEAAEKAAKAEAERVAQQQAAEAEAKRKAAEAEAQRQAELARQKAAAEAAAEAEAKRKAAQELAKQQQAQQAKAKAEAQRQAELAKQQAQQAQQKQQQPKARTHVVKEGETLYRIAVNYYGNGDAVERIKAANGLASNDIVVGSSLTLP